MAPDSIPEEVNAWRELILGSHPETAGQTEIAQLAYALGSNEAVRRDRPRAIGSRRNDN
jgi:hypothetical protein